MAGLVVRLEGDRGRPAHATSPRDGCSRQRATRCPSLEPARLWKQRDRGHSCRRALSSLQRCRRRELQMTLASDYLLARGCQLDRPELDVTGAAVGGHDDAARRDVALQHAETRWLRALAKETLSGSQGDRENLEPEFVNQIVL